MVQRTPRSWLRQAAGGAPPLWGGGEGESRATEAKPGGPHILQPAPESANALAAMPITWLSPFLTSRR